MQFLNVSHCSVVRARMCFGNLFVIRRSSTAGASTPHPSEVWTLHITRLAKRLCTKVSSDVLAAEETAWGSKQNKPMDGYECLRPTQNIISKKIQVQVLSRLNFQFRSDACVLRRWFAPIGVISGTRRDPVSGITIWAKPKLLETAWEGHLNTLNMRRTMVNIFLE